MNRKKIIGIMGPGSGANNEDLKAARLAGRIIATQGYILLTGGRASGVMEAALKGARDAGGTTIGILPGESPEQASSFVDIPIVTGMGSARNNINVLSSDLVIAVGLGAGTLSEIALAIKAGKPVILLNQPESSPTFIAELGYKELYFAGQPEDLEELIPKIINP